MLGAEGCCVELRRLVVLGVALGEWPFDGQYRLLLHL